MDPVATWDEITRFHEQGLATTAALHADAHEKLLVQQFLQRVPLEALFFVLQSASDAADAKKVKITCACINRVLGSDANEGMFYQPEMLPFILAGLTHHERAARLLSVNQLIGHLKNDPTTEQARALAEPTLLQELCQTMADEDVEISSKAASVLGLLARVPGGNFYEPILDALRLTVQNEDVTESSVEFMRYLEAIAKICEHSDRHMQYAITSGAVDLVLDALKSSDTLFVMNVLDLIPRLCQSPVGVVHIFESGTLHTLLGMKEDPFTGDSVLRLIGEISATAAKLNVESWNWNDPMLSKAFLATIEQKIQSANELQQIAAMDAIAAFASSSEKELHLFLQHKHLCKLILELGASTKMALKVNCFHAVARILGASTRLVQSENFVPDENANLWSLHERLFHALGVEARQPSTMALLMACLRQPFDEIRIAVYTLLRAVAAQNSDWGVRALVAYGGFIEFLLDRTTEPTKETREWKFAVVDALVSSRFESLLDAATRDNLAGHFAQGPYVGKGLTDMDMEAM